MKFKGGNKVQETILNFKEKEAVEVALEQVQKELLNISTSDSTYSNHLTQYLISRGGKRLRPLLVLLTSLHNGSMENSVKVAAASELIHTASLVHDDIVDDSHLRRGIKTINSKWNNSVAVLVGDFLFAKAFEILSQYQHLNLLRLYTNAISLMSVGELEQLKNQYNPDKTIEQYYSEIRGKTGVLIGACCQAGAILSNMDEHEVSALHSFGLELGYAFQITDDLLDIKGTSEITGKPIFKDLKEGNITLPLILLLNGNSYGGLVSEIIHERRFTQENLDYIYNELQSKEIINSVSSKAQKHVENCLNFLEKVRDFQGKDRLKILVELIIKRNK